MKHCRAYTLVHTALSTTVLFSCHATAQSTIDEQYARLLSDQSVVHDYFGESVAISNNIAVIGARWDEDNGTRAGAAYVFDTTTGRLIAKLLPDDGAPFDFFGISVAIHNDTVAVGATFSDTAFANSGAVYLFDASTGQQIAKLQPNDNESEKHFGRSIAIYNNFVLIGATGDNDNGDASGSAYLFDRTTATQLFKLLPDDGAEDDVFGVSVAINDATAIVGSTGDDDKGSHTGSAYLFDLFTGSQTAKLTPRDATSSDFFGSAIAATNTTIVITSPGDDDNGPNSGSAYLFDTNGQQIDKLLPNDGAPSDFFGTSAAIKDATVVIGAMRDDDNGEDSGSAYIFDTTTGNQVTKLHPINGTRADQFGQSIAIDGNTILVGAPNTDNISADSASAHLFTNACLPDINRDGNLNFLDVSAYLSSYAHQDPVADFILDDNINFLDVSVFLSAFGNSCP